MKIHISGPMTGRAAYNAASFAKVRDKLQAAGHETFSPPHDIPASTGYRHAMHVNLAWICEAADALISLPDWKESPGARAERFTALACGIPVWTWDFEEPPQIARRPFAICGPDEEANA